MKRFFFISFFISTFCSDVHGGLLSDISLRSVRQISSKKSTSDRAAALKRLERPMLYAPERGMYNLPKNDTSHAHKETKPCPFCTQLKEDNDAKHYILARLQWTAVFLNLFPYSKGHLLVIPNKHEGDLANIGSETRSELIETAAFCNTVLKNRLGATGANIGFNVGKVAGASIPDHLHMHIVPRGHVNIGYMQVIGNTLVTDYSLKQMYEELKSEFEKKKVC